MLPNVLSSHQLLRLKFKVGIFTVIYQLELLDLSFEARVYHWTRFEMNTMILTLKLVVKQSILD